MFWDEEKEKMSINIKPVQTEIHDVFVAVSIFTYFFPNLRGVYTGDVGLAISLSDVISIPRSIDFKWYIHFKSMPWR